MLCSVFVWGLVLWTGLRKGLCMGFMTEFDWGLVLWTGLGKGLCMGFTTEFDWPDVTLCSQQDVKIQLLTN